MKGMVPTIVGSSAASAVAPGPAPATAPAIRPCGGGLLVGVRVSPSSRRTALKGVYGDRLKVSVSAPPEDNRANQELMEALANWLEVTRDDVHIETGHKSRDKVVVFRGMGESELRRKLDGLLSVDRTRES
jgi:uncharacterized protein (TIGR00251 family)